MAITQKAAFRLSELAITSKIERDGVNRHRNLGPINQVYCLSTRNWAIVTPERRDGDFFTMRSLTHLVLWGSLVATTVLNPTVWAQGDQASDQTRTSRVEQALRRGRDFLVSQQAQDGHWGSKTYGILRTGSSLTPLVVRALVSSSKPAAHFKRPYQTGRRYLIKMSETEQDGKSELKQLAYPVYGSALALQILRSSSDQREDAAMKAYRQLLRSHRHSPKLGWKPQDAAYGGWGFTDEPPRRPEGAPLYFVAGPNLSATVEALLANEADPKLLSNEEREQVAVFIRRCQNLRPDSSSSRDGGFFFSPTDIMRNKADDAFPSAENPPTTFNSYGSATADGLLALLLLDDRQDQQAVEQARDWLIEHFDPDRHPGKFVKSRERFRDAYYFYYVHRLVDVFARLEEKKLLRRSKLLGGKPLDWAPKIADALLQRQRADGSWKNAFNDGKEDDPIIATALAVIALEKCRDRLTKSTLKPSQE